MTDSRPNPAPARDSSPSRRGSLALCVWSGPDLPVGLQHWQQLEQRLTEVPLAASHTWTNCWLRHYADLVPSTILTLERNDETVGAALITRGVGQKQGPVPLRTLHLGTAGEPLGQSVCVEYNDLLAQPADRATFIAALRGWIDRQRGIDDIRIDGWAAKELAPWTDGAKEAASRLRDCRYFDLDQARLRNVEPIELLGRSTRQNLRRLIRKYGDLETTWAESLEEADDIFRELVELHQARWKADGQPGAFASRRFEQFQRDLLVRGLGERKVVAFRVKHEGVTVGALLLLADRNRLLDYLSGFAPFDQKPSPGLVTHFLCLNEALRRGYSAYDFLVGDKRHKDNLSTDSQSLAWTVLRRRTLRNRAIDGLKRLKSVAAGLRPSRATAAVAPLEAPKAAEREESPASPSPATSH